jgi:hypothetical protein
MCLSGRWRARNKSGHDEIDDEFPRPAVVKRHPSRTEGVNSVMRRSQA